MKSSIPAQLTELLDLEMNGLSFDYVLNFSENIRSGQSLDRAREQSRAIISYLGMLLTIGVHPAWSEIVENATSNRWSEVLKKTKLGNF